MQACGLSSLPGRPRAWRQSLFCCWRMKPGAGSTSKNSTEYRCTVVEFSLDCGWMTSKPQIEVQPSPKVPLRPRNSACKVKSRLSHIIMMLPRRGNIMLVRYFTRPSRIEELHSSSGGHLLEGFANQLSQSRYRRVAARKHIRAAEHFLHWIAHRNLSITSVEGRYAQQFLDHLKRCRCRGHHPPMPIWQLLWSILSGMQGFNLQFGSQLRVLRNYRANTR